MSDGLHNSSVMLEIRLIDVNDRNPEFNSSIHYSAYVPEVSGKYLIAWFFTTFEYLKRRLERNCSNKDYFVFN